MAQRTKCAICDQPVPGKFFMVEDKVDGSKKNICPACAELDAWCFVCNVPVKDKFTRLADGRVICSRDLRDAILTDEDMRAAWAATREDLATVFGRFTTFTRIGVSVRLVDKVHLEKIFKSPGYTKECGSIFGATQSRVDVDDHYEHTISLLSGLKKARLMAVLAHEYGHTWIRENVKPGRKLASDAEEGFCEWLAYKIMELRNDSNEMKVISSNLYTRGQIAAFQEADRQFGVYRVVEWMKDGIDPQIDVAQLDRVKFLQPKTAGTPLVWNIPAPAAARPIETLTLQGISGPPTRRLALINNCPLLVREEAKVPLGGSNVVVRVLEISDRAVVVSLNGNSERKELQLAPRK